MDSRLPRLSAFTAGLPDGLDSYPETRAKASMNRVYCESLQPTLARDPTVVPDRIRELVQNPAPVSAWIPVVHSHAVMLAACDLAFESEDAFVEHTYQEQRALLSSRLYRILLALAKPEMLIRVAPMRWSVFHRGSSLSIEDSSPTTVRIRVDHPPGLWFGVAARSLAAGLRGSLELSGAHDAQLDVVSRTPGVLHMEGSWTL
ncbi:MAG: hypothetical protein ACRBN8_29180 [Nannocystales bacterium]